jgi:hypothetical protein
MAAGVPGGHEHHAKSSAEVCETHDNVAQSVEALRAVVAALAVLL